VWLAGESCSVDPTKLPTAAVVPVIVGPSGSQQKCVPGEGVSCAANAANFGHRVNMDHSKAHAEFFITHDPNGDICSTRRDASQGWWGMNLMMLCKMTSPPPAKKVVLRKTVVVTIGQSTAKKKSVGVQSGVTCTRDAGNKGNHVNHDHANANDRFDITEAPNEDVCAERLDKQRKMFRKGWEMNLQLRCILG